MMLNTKGRSLWMGRQLHCRIIRLPLSQSCGTKLHPVLQDDVTLLELMYMY